MRQPFFKIWGHALGRLVLRRDPIAVRLDEVLDAIAESRAAIEINGDPYRLDLDPVNARKAAARGIKFVLSSDAHSTRGARAVRYAVAMARRARIRKRDVLNALPPTSWRRRSVQHRAQRERIVHGVALGVVVEVDVDVATLVEPALARRRPTRREAAPGCSSSAYLRVWPCSRT